MKIYCDMDGVLVRHIGSDGFDSMPWMPDGRAVWEFIKPYSPTLLSQLPDANYERCAPQKRAWAARELGPDVPVIIVRRSIGKDPGHAAPDAILIDDDARRHGVRWIAAGGIFVHHVSAAATISALGKLLEFANR